MDVPFGPCIAARQDFQSLQGCVTARTGLLST